MRKTPVVLGVLNIVFGSIMVATAIYSVASLFFTDMMFGTFSGVFKNLPRTPGMPDMSKFYDTLNGFIHVARPYFIIVWGVKAALSGWLIWIGWGLYRRLGSMRMQAVYWSAIALVSLVGESIFQLGWYVPKMLAVMEPFYRDMPLGEMQVSLQHKFSYFGVILGTLFNAAYPVILMALIGRKSAARDLI